MELPCHSRQSRQLINSISSGRTRSGVQERASDTRRVDQLFSFVCLKRLRAEGRTISHIARETGVSRPTIYKILGEECPSTEGDRQSRKRGSSGA